MILVKVYKFYPYNSQRVYNFFVKKFLAKKKTIYTCIGYIAY